MAVNLKDRTTFSAVDPHGMLKITEEFPQQCRQALEIARSVELDEFATLPAVVVLTGLGGSAAGGDFCKALFDQHGAAPFVVNRDYVLPNYVGLRDLVFVCSYSGNTEETLSAYSSAVKAGAKIIAITSGGELAARAKADGHTVVTVPGGQPPRTAMGFMTIPVIYICEKLKLIEPQDYEEAFTVLDKASALWTAEGAEDGPKELAEALVDRLPVVYGLGQWQGMVAGRWKSQLNENAKVLAHANTFPELNHNEILGWVGAERQGLGKCVVVTLQDGKESPNMRTRLRVTKNLLGSKVRFFDVHAIGEGLLAKLLSLAYYADFTSYYLALLLEVDPENIDSIDVLKQELLKSSK